MPEPTYLGVGQSLQKGHFFWENGDSMYQKSKARIPATRPFTIKRRSRLEDCPIFWSLIRIRFEPEHDLINNQICYTMTVWPLAYTKEMITTTQMQHVYLVHLMIQAWMAQTYIACTQFTSIYKSTTFLAKHHKLQSKDFHDSHQAYESAESQQRGSENVLNLCNKWSLKSRTNERWQKENKILVQTAQFSMARQKFSPKHCQKSVRIITCHLPMLCPKTRSQDISRQNAILIAWWIVPYFFKSQKGWNLLNLSALTFCNMQLATI